MEEDLLLKYSVERIVGPINAVKFVVYSQKHICRGFSPIEWRFVSSTGFFIASHASVMAFDSGVRLLGCHESTVGQDYTGFATKEAASEWIARLHHAIAEWAIWGGFANEIHGACTVPLPFDKRDCAIGTFKVYATNQLEHQLATF